MSKQPWLASELGVWAALRQSVGLARAGLGRPWLTLLLAVGVSLGVLCLLVFGKRNHSPTFVLRVVEGEHRSGNGPPLRRQLAEYVRQGVLTSEPLFEIMRRHELYTGLMRRNERAALDAFKEDIAVDVYQNFFVEQRRDAPRSARLVVSFRAKDPKIALAVTRDLGAYIVRHELLARREQALSSAESAGRARDVLLSAWQSRSMAVVEKQAQLLGATAPQPRLQVELIGLLGSLGPLSQQVEASERRAAVLELGANLERRGLGLRFEVVDEGSLPARASLLQARLVATAASFFLGLPLIALGVGAFSTTRRGQA